MRYARFVTNRVSVGPLLDIYKTTGSDATAGIGGSVAYHFRPLSAAVIPFVEATSSKGLGTGNYNADMQLIGGLKVPLGSSGARLKFGPYFYRAWYDQAKNGFDSFESIGFSWNVGLLWK